MDTKYEPYKYEPAIYDFWQQSGYLKPKAGEPFTILMPPPNANASLHAGHGMYTIEDIVIRYKRLRGQASLWIPGTDHAGFETQYVYEKQLAKQEKSRLDFDRKTLHDNIFKFVKDNSGLIFEQFKRLGFLADWSRSVFALDNNVVDYVYKTFFKMHNDGLIYRSDYIVNYCVFCGTSLSELEVKHIERTDPLYYIKYGPFVLATVRPETKFGDTAVAVNPKDNRYRQWIGKEIEVKGLLGKFKLKVIADEYVDPEFGTGVVKITPAHDPNDFAIGQKHGLEIKQAIDLNGRMTAITGPYQGLKVKAAREKVIADLKARNLIEKIDGNYNHAVTVCYKCGRDLEPMIIPNWFIKVDGLKKPVIDAIKKDKIKFYPGKYKQRILDWLKIMHDWPISRQIVWAIRIPVWYRVDDNPDLFVVFINKKSEIKSGFIRELLKDYQLSEIKEGLQHLSAPKNAKYIIDSNEPGEGYLQETDVFDTWFSSGQWPLVSCISLPTDFMGTLYEILPFWVSRMIMFSLYLENKIPFKTVYIWSMVADNKGLKMSKSKGNVVNPIDYVDKYGADAFRASLLFGIGEGSKVILAENKVMAMRNYANKIWNIARFIKLNETGELKVKSEKLKVIKTKEIINKLVTEFEDLKNRTIKNLDNYKFSRAFDDLYEFIWHRLADYYIEQLKDDIICGDKTAQDAIAKVFFNCLIMLHPFMPFVTEAIWQDFKGKQSSILDERLRS